MKLRAVLKWTGASLCALIFAAWFASRWFNVRVVYLRTNVFRNAWVANGCLEVSQVDLGPHSIDNPQGWSVWLRRNRPDDVGWRWLPESDSWDSDQMHSDSIQIPLHMPFAALAIPVTWLLYRDHRSVRWARAGRCAKCGYSLSGLPPGGACPECGKGGSS